MKQYHYQRFSLGSNFRIKALPMGTIQANEKKYNFIKKPKSVMGDWLGLHWLVPGIKQKIKEGDVWIREDVWINFPRRAMVIAHEKAELRQMIDLGVSYEEAHKWAEFVDGNW